MLVVAPVIGLAAAQGGFYPTAWGWASVPLLCLAGVALIARAHIRLGRLERVFLAGVVCLTGWTALSIAWSVAPPESVLEVERDLVYVAGVAVVLVMGRSRSARQVLGATLGAISLLAFISLLTRLLPDRVRIFDRTGVYRLAEPIGYWNGLAIFAVIGVLLALSFGARARSATARAASAAALPILLLTFYLTFGRGGWIALAIGFIAVLGVDPRRLQFLSTTLALIPGPAVVVWIASRSAGLTTAGASATRAAHDGHRVAAVLVAVSAANAVLATAFAVAERRITVGVSVKRAFALTAVLAAAAGLAVVFARYGGPTTIAQKGYAAFKAPPPHASRNLNRRLLNFSGNGRAALWRLAWNDAKAHPLTGAGAGTYERYFLAHQPAGVGRVQDAHGLYIETLAELGPVGVLLLALVLVAPYLAIPAARRHPLVPGAIGAYTAYVVHAAADWDWELPAVTLAALFCGTAVLLAARRADRPRELPGLVRAAAAVAVIPVMGFAVIGLIGNIDLSRSESALRQGAYASAVTEARHAHAWMPWSAEPWLALGRAQLQAGDAISARRSFESAVARDRNDWKVWYYLASVTSGKPRTRALHEAALRFPRANFVGSGPRHGRSG